MAEKEEDDATGKKRSRHLLLVCPLIYIALISYYFGYKSCSIFNNQREIELYGHGTEYIDVFVANCHKRKYPSINRYSFVSYFSLKCYESERTLVVLKG